MLVRLKSFLTAKQKSPLLTGIEPTNQKFPRIWEALYTTRPRWLFDRGGINCYPYWEQKKYFLLAARRENPRTHWRFLWTQEFQSRSRNGVPLIRAWGGDGGGSAWGGGGCVWDGGGHTCGEGECIWGSCLLVFAPVWIQVGSCWVGMGGAGVGGVGLHFWTFGSCSQNSPHSPNSPTLLQLTWTQNFRRIRRIALKFFFA